MLSFCSVDDFCCAETSKFKIPFKNFCFYFFFFFLAVLGLYCGIHALRCGSRALSTFGVLELLSGCGEMA